MLPGNNRAPVSRNPLRNFFIRLIPLLLLLWYTYNSVTQLQEEHERQEEELEGFKDGVNKYEAEFRSKLMDIQAEVNEIAGYLKKTEEEAGSAKNSLTDIGTKVDDMMSSADQKTSRNQREIQEIHDKMHTLVNDAYRLQDDVRNLNIRSNSIMSRAPDIERLKEQIEVVRNGMAAISPPPAAGAPGAQDAGQQLANMEKQTNELAEKSAKLESQYTQLMESLSNVNGPSSALSQMEKNIQQMEQTLKASKVELQQYVQQHIATAAADIKATAAAAKATVADTAADTATASTAGTAKAPEADTQPSTAQSTNATAASNPPKQT